MKRDVQIHGITFGELLRAHVDDKPSQIVVTVNGRVLVSGMASPSLLDGGIAYRDIAEPTEAQQWLDRNNPGPVIE